MKKENKIMGGWLVVLVLHVYKKKQGGDFLKGTFCGHVHARRVQVVRPTA